MFEHLNTFRIILVTGPQRSGTTIATRMIAEDTGHAFIRESWYENDEARLRFLVGSGHDLVIHCPAYAHLVHDFRDYHDVAVVFMIRDTADIIASQERINWTWEQAELAKYGEWYEPPVCEVKREFWRTYQQPYLPHPFEVAYESLADHPLWVPKELRDNWHYKQIDLANAW